LCAWPLHRAHRDLDDRDGGTGVCRPGLVVSTTGLAYAVDRAGVAAVGGPRPGAGGGDGHLPGQYPARVSDHGFWAVQSLVTEPGPAAAAIDRLPSGLGALRAASRQLVFHHWADGDWAENGIAPERISEIDTRYAAAMFARLGELADLPLSAARQPRQRLVGCCRDFTVLFVAMARHKGIPARARVGFARYLIDGWLIDHEIAEVWDGPAGRWRLVEPEIDDGHADPAGGASFDALDVPPGRFLTAPRAWQLARCGAAGPERFVIDPGLENPATRGWPQLRRSLVHDLAALNKTEMLLWEDWGVPDSRTAPGPGELPALDELATLTGQPSPPLAGLRSAYRRPQFAVPDTVTSYSPARTDVPAVVDVSAVARAAS
jgi:Transglutaminase-like superfamily